MGASGVKVNGTLYDVTFGDDTFANSITAFTTLADATAASKALLDQVLVGDYGVGGSKIINGCTVAAGCSVDTGYETVTVYSRTTYQGVNFADARIVNGIATFGNTLNNRATDDTYLTSHTIAKWKVSTTATAVPEPEAYAMMLAGLGLVGFAARRKQKTA